MDHEKDPLDAGLSAAFGETRRPESVLTLIERKVGDEMRVALREEGSAGDTSPVIDPSSAEKLALPRGRGNYQLMGEIARGGMGVVIKGHDTDLGRDVALKVLNRKLADRADILQRFVEEAQIGGQLQHPGIVPVYELGLMADERPYFTMKLVKGRTFATLLAEREVLEADRRRMLDVFASVCQTIAYAHSRGVIHRDLKPSNVMVGAFGEVQVVDWGLAKVLARGGTADEKKAKDARSANTVLETVRTPREDGSGSGSDSVIGSVMGTPAYMPPEQAGGHVDRLDERSDVFSLGAILCEILTGSPPYMGEKEKTLEEAAHAELDDALERLDMCNADPELVKLAKHCLVAAPTARPRNASVVAERIRRYLESVEERAQTARIEAAVHMRARKLTAALAATVLVAGLGLGGGWLWVQNQALERERAANARQRDLAASVNGFLGEVAAFQEQELFDQAILKAEQAQALAQGNDGDAELSRRIQGAVDGVERARQRAAEREELRAELLAVGLDTTRPWRFMDQDFAAIFRRRGIDPDSAPPEETAEALQDLGIDADLPTILDRWILGRRRFDPGISSNLVDVAFLVDPDELSNDLRAAVLLGDREMLLELARLDLGRFRPSTLFLLGLALVDVSQEDEGERVLREAVALHPGDVYLRCALVVELGDKGQEGLFHGPVLAALVPRDVSAQRVYAQALTDQAREAQRAGRNAWARMYRQEAAAVHAAFVKLAPDDADAHYGLGHSMQEVDETGRAAPAYRRALALANGDEPWIADAEQRLAELEKNDE